jgi:hypothetical protein
VDAIDTAAWADNARLNQWLHSQAAAFPVWAEQPSDNWDFSTQSLDRLEAEIKRRYPGREYAHADRGSAFLDVAAWYVGEVHVRNFGAVWRCAPEVAPGVDPRIEPLVTLPKDVLEEWELEEFRAQEDLYEDDFPLFAPYDSVVGAADPGQSRREPRRVAGRAGGGAPSLA